MFSYRHLSTSKATKSSGFALIDALIWATVIMAFLGVALYAWMEYDKHNSARIAGRWLGTVIAGLRAKMSDEGDTITLGTFKGVDFLKSKFDCKGGESAKPYLHICELPNETEFGLTITTKIEKRNPADPDNKGIIATIETNQIQTEDIDPSNPPPNGPRGDLLGEIARIANAGDFDTGQPMVGTSYYATNDINKGIVRAFVTNDQSVDIYLRADGTRDWAGDQNVNDHQLLNVKGITGTGKVENSNGQVIGTGLTNQSGFVDTDLDQEPVDPNLPLGDADKLPFMVDPRGVTRLNILKANKITGPIEADDDIFMKKVKGGKGEFLTNMIAHERQLLPQGGFIGFPTCPNGTPEIRGSVAGFVVKKVDPLSIKGFNVFAKPVSNGWQVFAGAFVRPVSGTGVAEFVLPDSKDGIVKIDTATYCSPKNAT